MLLLLLACANDSAKPNSGTSPPDTDPADPADTHGDTAPADTADTADTGPTEPVVVPPCDWASYARPHWSLAIPWLLADPGLADGTIAGLDAGTAAISGTVDAGGGFRIDVSPSAYSIFATAALDGVFDPTTGTGSWTFAWSMLDGAEGERVVEARWEGCTLVETFDTAAPWLDVTWSDWPASPAERRTWFDTEGRATSVGVTLDGLDDQCGYDTVIAWSTVLGADGNVLGSGTFTRDDAYVHDYASWRVAGDAWAPGLVLNLDRAYAICCCSTGTGGSSVTRVEADAGTLPHWELTQSWSLYDRDLGEWTFEGSAEIQGRTDRSGTTSLAIAYIEDYHHDRGGDTSEDVACDGAWTAADGVRWECAVDPRTGVDAWAAPPTWGPWAF